MEAVTKGTGQPRLQRGSPCLSPMQFRWAVFPFHSNTLSGIQAKANKKLSWRFFLQLNNK